MNPQITEFIPSQQKAVKDFVVECWKEFGFTYIQEYDYDLDDPKHFYEDAGGEFYILSLNNKIIGTIGVIKKSEKIAELKRFYIDPTFRKKGYGSLLYDKAWEFCKDNGFEKIELQTDKIFKDGHTFYKNRGFAVVKEDEEGYYMEKLLA